MLIKNFVAHPAVIFSSDTWLVNEIKSEREIVFHCYICMENKWIRKCSVVKYLIHRQSQSKCLHIWNVKCVPRVQKVSFCFPATRAISRENCMDLSFRCIERDSARWTFLGENAILRKIHTISCRLHATANLPYSGNATISWVKFWVAARLVNALVVIAANMNRHLKT